MTKFNTNIFWSTWHFLVKLWEATGTDYGNIPFFENSVKDKTRNKTILRVSLLEYLCFFFLWECYMGNISSWTLLRKLLE